MSKTGREARLRLLGEHRTAAPIRASTLRQDNRTELTAVITESHEVLIYRLGGQLVHRVESDAFSGAPTCLEWFREGMVLLIGTDSGIVDYLSLASLRLTKGTRIPPHGSKAVTGIRSHVHATVDQSDPQATTSTDLLNGMTGDEAQIADSLDKFSISDNFTDHDGLIAKEVVSLPLMLANLDCTDVLPKLSPTPLPCRAGPGIPAPVIRDYKKDLHIPGSNKDVVEVTFTSFDDGSVESTTSNIFHRMFSKDLNQGQEFLSQCASSSRGMHAMINRLVGAQGTAAVSVDLFQLPFYRSESVHTTTMFSNALQLHRLEQYLSQSIAVAATDFSTLTALPTRFIDNINESLEANGEGSLQNALAQLLLTGSCSDIVTEWLKDELAERGHKRWELSMTTLFQAHAQILELNILPALERCSVNASLLRGLANYYDGSKKFDVRPIYLTSILSAVECAQVLAHEALRILGIERAQFAAFSAWLRTRVDIAASEAGSTTHTELLESEAVNTDVDLVLSYLSGPFMVSKLKPLLSRAPGVATNYSTPSFNTLGEALDIATQAIKKHRELQGCDDEVLNLQLRVAQLHQAVDVCLAQMKEWHSKTWQAPAPIQIHFDAPVSAIDVQLQPHANQTTIVAVGVEEGSGHSLQIQRLAVVDDSKSSIMTGNQASVVVELPEGFRILDVRLLHHGDIVALVEASPAQQARGERAIIQLPASMLVGEHASLAVSVSELERLKVHTFSGDDAFEAAFIYISEGKRGSKVIVLERQHTSWRIFRLPNRENIRSAANGTTPLQTQHAVSTSSGSGDMMLTD